MNEYEFKRIVKFFNDKHMENNPKEEWDANTRANLHRFNKDNCIWKLMDKHMEDAIVVVGASPALTEDVKKLAKLEEHPLRKRFVVIVVNAALKVCLEHGVKPDYVIAIDGSPATIVDDLRCKNDDLKLICTNSVAPKIFDVWEGKEIWWMPYYSLSKDLAKEVKKKLGRKIPSGGNNFSSALSIGYSVFGARIFVMVGCEHCYDEQYYAHKKSKWEKANKASHWKVKDIKGHERWTNIPLWQYKIWIEKMVEELPHCIFIDTSWGVIGTDNKRIIHEDFNDAIKEVSDAFEITDKAKTDPNVAEKLRYDSAYSTGKYIPTIGIDFWKIILSIYDFSKVKRVLDVGTGIGQVVAHLRNEGFEAYGTDIADTAVDYWKLGNITQFCYVCPASKLPFEDNYFDVVSCTEVLEHIQEDNMLASLKEIYRVGRGDFILSYALGRSFHKMPYDDSEPHVCIKPVQWWNDIVQEAGFHIIESGMNAAQTSGMIYATKGIKDDKGKMPTGTMYIQSKEGMPVGGRFIRLQGGNRPPKQRNRRVSRMRPTGVAAG